LDNKKVFQTRKKMFSLPIFSIGLELSNGLLSYNKFFKIIKSRHEMVAITHTETPSGLLSKFYDPDPASLSNALTEKGQKDARALGYSLRAEFGEKPVVILHAKNTRTFQTALAIREQLPQAKMECANWLNEIYCSEWLGQDSGKVLQTNFTASSMFHHSNCLAHPKDGENFLEFLNKIYLGLKELQQRDVNDTTILLCTSRVNLVALKILTQRDIEYDSNTRIDWARMAHKSKAGTVFRFNHYPIEQTHRVNEKS